MIYKATMALRWNWTQQFQHRVLEQAWQAEDGTVEWRPVPIHTPEGAFYTEIEPFDLLKPQS